MAEEIDEELILSLEKRIEDLRNWFEQYFMGSRKRAPLQERTTVQYQIRRLANQRISNTRLNFQFQQVVAKFNTYNQHWNRTLQQMESGTYFRDRFKMKMKDQVAADEIKPPPRRQAAATADDDINKLHRDFIEARKQCNQPANVSRDKLAEQIKKQLPTLQQKYQGKEVKFKVVVENGQAKLKATVK